MTDAEEPGIEHPERLGDCDYSPEWLCAVGENLDVGDEVYLNTRTTPLTVTDTGIDTGAGTDYPYTVVYLEGHGTEYRLKIPNTPSHVFLYWPSRNSGKEIRRIEPADGGTTALVAKKSAEEFIEPTVAETDTLGDALDGLGGTTVADGDRLGDCPDCGETVVDSEGRATCTGCPLWCPRDEWDAFHGRADQ